jgi:hypothetical protein
VPRDDLLSDLLAVSDSDDGRLTGHPGGPVGW